MTTPIEKKLKQWMLVIAILLFFFVGLTWRSLTNSREATRWVEHTYTVLDICQHLVQDVYRAESSQNAYLVGGNPAYITYREDALSRIAIGITRAKARTGDNPRQKTRLNKLEDLVAARTELMRQEQKLRDTIGLSAMSSHFSEINSQPTASRFVIEDMIAEEEELLRQRKVAEDIAWQRAEIVLSLIILSLIASSMAMFFRLRSDLRYRMQAEAALLIAKESAETANRSKSEFLANMSHEIRTPMNGIIGLLQQLLKTPVSQQQRDYLNLIKISSDALLRLLNDILDLSKLDAKRMELDLAECDIRELIGDTLKMFAAKAHEKNLELTHQISPSVPQAVVADPGRMAQIMLNLVGNALKFTFKGEVVVRVSETSRTHDGSILLFEITDTGIGIKQDQQERLFGAFQQADSSTTRQFGGTGLGLTISKELIALMGGEIAVESIYGQGTTFSFSLRFPLVENSRQSLQEMAKTHLQEMSVLVVDDNQANGTLLNEVLNSWGMRPMLARSGQEALACMQSSKEVHKVIDLIILDAQMPDFDGFRVAGEIRSRGDGASPTIMMLSTSDLDNDIDRCKILGVHNYVIKPIKQSELYNAIVEALNADSKEVQGFTGAALPELASRGRSFHILVAEDHDINRAVIEIALTEWGHTFSFAETGLEALRKLEQESFDLILMDGQMPELDGYGATAEIRRREQHTGLHIPIIALTANAMKEDREKCLLAGMDDYVSKPIDFDLLFEKIVTNVRDKSAQVLE